MDFKRKKFLIFAVLFTVVTAIAIVVVIFTGSYPVLIVNGEQVSYGVFRKEYKGASNYYGRALETYDKKDKDILNSKDMTYEIKRSVLSGLIEERLIREELERRMSKDDISGVVSRKVEDVLKGVSVEKEVKALYGLSLAEFSDLVLRPQAEKEALEGRFILENKNFEDWLAEAKSKAGIQVILPGFVWDGKEIVKKSN